MNIYLDTEFHEYKKQTKFLGIPFSEGVDTIELISIGLIRGDGKKYYAISKDFDVNNAWDNEWLRENVLKSIFNELISQQAKRDLKLFQLGVAPSKEVENKFTCKNLKKILNKLGKTNRDITEEILRFTDCVFQGSEIGEATNVKPKFYAYYGDYDWVVFCWLFGRMIDLPKGYPMYCVDLKQMLDEQGNPNIQHIKDLNKNEHNALADAEFNKNLHEYLTKINNK